MDFHSKLATTDEDISQFIPIGNELGGDEDPQKDDDLILSATTLHWEYIRNIFTPLTSLLLSIMNMIFITLNGDLWTWCNNDTSLYFIKNILSRTSL